MSATKKPAFPIATGSDISDYDTPNCPHCGSETTRKVTRVGDSGAQTPGAKISEWYGEIRCCASWWRTPRGSECRDNPVSVVSVDRKSTETDQGGQADE